MKKSLFLLLIAALYLTSCKNDSSAVKAPVAPAPEAATTPAAIVITPEQVKDADVRAKKLLSDMEQFHEDLKKSKASASKDQRDALEVLRSQVSDVIEKQTMMVHGIESAVGAPEAALKTGGTPDTDIPANSAIPPPGVLKDYIESIDLYTKTIEDFKKQYEEINKGTGKKN